MALPSETCKRKRAAELRKLRRQRVSQMVWDYLKNHPCVHCGETNPVLLEFDHISQEDKVDSVSRLVKNGYSESTVFREIAKCQVLCANCHRLRTAQQLGWYRYMRCDISSPNDST